MAMGEAVAAAPPARAASAPGSVSPSAPAAVATDSRIPSTSAMYPLATASRTWVAKPALVAPTISSSAPLPEVTAAPKPSGTISAASASSSSTAWRATSAPSTSRIVAIPESSRPVRAPVRRALLMSEPSASAYA
jgi:hypothetical protein